MSATYTALVSGIHAITPYVEVATITAGGGYWWRGIPIHWCAIAALVLHLINFGVALAERSRS